VFGTIIPNGSRNKNRKRSVKRFDLEKVFLCSSDLESYLPLYDPDGSVYNRGPQFGCIKPDKMLSHRYILLDRTAREHRLSKIRESSFNAEFFTSQLNDQTITGFKFNMDGIFMQSNSTKKIWYLQVVFLAGSSHLKNTRRNVKLYSLNSPSTNGTNIQAIKISNEPHKVIVENFTEWIIRSKAWNMSHHNILINKTKKQVFSFKEIFTKFLLPIFMFIIFILFLIITVIFCRKEKMKKNFFQLPTMDYLSSRTCGSFKSKNSKTKISGKKIVKSKSCSSNNNIDCEKKKPLSSLKSFLNLPKNKSLAKNRSFQLSFKKKSKSSQVTFNSAQTSEPICNSINYKDDMLDEKLNFDISKFNELNSKLNTLTKDSNNPAQSSNNCSIYNNSFHTLQSNSKKSQILKIKAKPHEKTDLLKSLKKTENNFSGSETIQFKTTLDKATANKKISRLNLRNFFQKFSLKKSKVTKPSKKSILKINHSHSQSSYFRNQPVQSHSGILKSFSNQSFNQKINTKNRNNYLYFNYNNNKMHYLNTDTDLVINDSNTFLNNNLNNDITVSNQNLLVTQAAKNNDSVTASTLNSNSNQLGTNSISLSTSTKYILANKFKRLSGTEV